MYVCYTCRQKVYIFNNQLFTTMKRPEQWASEIQLHCGRCTPTRDIKTLWTRDTFPWYRKRNNGHSSQRDALQTFLSHRSASFVSIKVYSSAGSSAKNCGLSKQQRARSVAFPLTARPRKSKSIKERGHNALEPNGQARALYYDISSRGRPSSRKSPNALAARLLLFSSASRLKQSRGLENKALFMRSSLGLLMGAGLSLIRVTGINLNSTRAEVGARRLIQMSR